MSEISDSGQSAADEDVPAPSIDLDDLLHPEEQRRFRNLCLPTNSFELAETIQTVRLHIEHVRTHADSKTDVDMAERIATAFEALLDAELGFADDERALIRGAVEYFLLDDDADGDMEDPVGFDDDARVLNSVLDRIGQPQFKINF